MDPILNLLARPLCGWHVLIALFVAWCLVAWVIDTLTHELRSLRFAVQDVRDRLPKQDRPAHPL